MFFSTLQKIGKSLMLPVSVLPVAGILLGVGAANFGFMPELLSKLMTSSGDFIFSSLPLLFAIGVALGFTQNDGVSGLSAFIGYGIMLGTMGIMGTTLGVETKTMMGISTINTGVFGGIVIGIITSLIFNRFYKINLPVYLGFFSGKRIVPIIVSFAAILTGISLSFLWPPIGNLIQKFSHWAASENPKLAFLIYGLGERSLIPFGLHHIWNVPFFFETGSFLDPASGKTVSGEIARYISGDPLAGNLAGGYLFKMWGLPAAALAIWHTAKPENKKKIAGIMLSAALTSFLTGITEPIEFAFLFVAPLLYGAHAILSGIAFWVCITLGIKHGTTFSHGLIDFVVLFSKSSNAYLLWLIGPLWGLLYYGVFRFFIVKFDLKTPGREIESQNTSALTSAEGSSEDTFLKDLVQSLGGVKNIKSIDACITRLRIDLLNSANVNQDKIKELGAAGVFIIGNGLQAIFGTRSENIKTLLLEHLNRSRTPTANDSKKPVLPNSTTETIQMSDVIIDILGGAENILNVSSVAHTRIRILTKDLSSVNTQALEKITSRKVVIYDGGIIHLIVGPNGFSNLKEHFEHFA